MVAAGEPGRSAGVFDYCVAKVSEKKALQDSPSRAASSSSPAGVLRLLRGCAETSYARLVTQLFGDRCTSPTLPAAPPSGAARCHLSVHRQQGHGHGPAWATPCSRITRARPRHVPRPEEDPRGPDRPRIMSRCREGFSRAEGCRSRSLETKDDTEANDEPQRPDRRAGEGAAAAATLQVARS